MKKVSLQQTQMMPAEEIARFIHSMRDQRVILDSDLSAVYGVQTRALNQAVKRNPCRFRQSLFFSLPLRKLPMCSV